MILRIRRDIVYKYKSLKANSNWWEEADFATFCAQTYIQQKERSFVKRYRKRQI